MLESFFYNLGMLVLMIICAFIILATCLVGLGNLLLGSGRWKVYGAFILLLGLAMIAAAMTLLEAYGKTV